MGQALYRKYRSKTLAEMVGQEHITEALGNAVKSGRISHAYLFTGPRGVGKTSAARILAHEINGLPYDDSQHLDIIEIDAASNRRIDDIRDLRDKVHIAPGSAKYKVYIIDEVHMLTGESFNALLKTLEEPPEHAVFILATTEVHKLPATIISRTQRFNFHLIDTQKMIAHLRFIAKQEGFTADDDALALIAEYGEGSFRDSINLLDQLANIDGGIITVQGVEKSLGLASQKAIESLVGTLLKKDFAEANKQLTELESQGAHAASLVPQLIRCLQGLAPKHTELYTLLDQLIEVPRSYNPKLKLRTTLVRFALPDPQSPPAKAAGARNVDHPPTPAVSHQPTPVAAKPILNVEAPRRKSAAAKAEPQEPQQAEGNKLEELTGDQWAQILDRIKEESGPFYGILRQAQPVFDAAAQTLTLKFRYSLHQKRADDAKPKKLLARIMLELLGGAPIIQTQIDPAAAAPEAAPAPSAPKAQHSPSAADSIAKSVMDVMGGGEVVDA